MITNKLDGNSKENAIKNKFFGAIEFLFSRIIDFSLLATVGFCVATGVAWMPLVASCAALALWSSLPSSGMQKLYHARLFSDDKIKKMEKTLPPLTLASALRAPTPPHHA